MMHRLCEILVTDSLLHAPPQEHDVDAGAMIDFWGVVRNLENEREIAGIEYEAHREMAEHQLRQIAKQAVDKFGLRLVLLHHRIGLVAVGETSLFLRVTSRHRSEGFRASQWIVDELKKKVPIWKRPRFKSESDKRPGSAPAARTMAVAV